MSAEAELSLALAYFLSKLVASAFASTLRLLRALMRFLQLSWNSTKIGASLSAVVEDQMTVL